MSAKGIVAAPCTQEQIADWYDHYRRAVCGPGPTEFTAIVPNVDKHFPEEQSNFWRKWIPALDKSLREEFMPPFGCGKLGVVYLERVEGGFDFLAANPYTWVDTRIITNPEDAPRIEAHLRTNLLERHGTSAIIRFVAYEDCPLTCVLALYRLFKIERIRTFDVQGLPSDEDPIWYVNSLWSPVRARHAQET